MRERETDRLQREGCLQIIVDAINDDGGRRDYRNEATYRAAEEAWAGRDLALTEHALRLCESEIRTADQTREAALLKIEDAEGTIDPLADQVQAIEEAYNVAVKSAEEKAMAPLIEATRIALKPV